MDGSHKQETATMSENEEHHDDKPIISDVLLRRLNEQLATRGFLIRTVLHGRELVQVEISNPDDPDRGRVILGYDGLLTWEYNGTLIADSDVDTCADLVLALLNSGPPNRLDTGHASEAPARVTLDEARVGPEFGAEQRKYMRLAALLRREITSGQLGPGSSLPSIESFRQTYEMSRQTVSKTLQALERERLIYRMPGLGYFVGPGGRV
jgi:hypothetical protein